MEVYAVPLSHLPAISLPGDFECPGDLALLTPLCEHLRRVDIRKGLTE